jgi:hypothetical protein
VYSWFVVDHVGYTDNPRRRDIGYHNVFDHYRRLLHETGSTHDDLQFHFHPMSTYREAHVCATSYLNSPHLLETLARRIIDRGWFPSCFRPGFHAERPDAHWFLEQWLPFDFANQAMPDDADVERQRDLAAGAWAIGAARPTTGRTTGRATTTTRRPATAAARSSAASTSAPDCGC